MKDEKLLSLLLPDHLREQCTLEPIIYLRPSQVYSSLLLSSPLFPDQLSVGLSGETLTNQLGGSERIFEQPLR